VATFCSNCALFHFNMAIDCFKVSTLCSISAT
jgi:hypothetical protein